jgi:site-specific DNA-cytosine methylase
MSGDANRLLRELLAEEPTGGLSAAQLVRHLVLQLMAVEGSLKDYFLWSLQSPERVEGRVVNLFPLPLWYDDREALIEILDEANVKGRPGQWRKRGDTKSKAAKALRGNGLRAWHGLIVVALNHLYGDEAGAQRPAPGSQATAPQEQALSTLWELVKGFIDEKEKGGVPRTSLENWEHAIDSLRISYTGEVIEKAVDLTLEQVLPGLPSVEHGASVDITEVLPAYLKEELLHPERLLLEPPQGKRPYPRVRAAPGEWPKVAKALFERGLVTPVDRCPELEGEKLVNGSFGVSKPDKHTESGLPVLRLIMDLRATNYAMAQIDGDVGSLTGASGFQRIVIDSDEELLVSGEDLTAAFYLFRLPDIWAQYMVLEQPVERAVLGLPGEGQTLLGICVLPMGWHSAVGLMQSCHREIALRSRSLGGAGLEPLAEISRNATFPDLDEYNGWSIYLDDTTILEKVSSAVVAELEGKPAEEQRQPREAYAWWGIPRNTGKSLQRCKQAERLGALIDGKAGILKTRSKRTLDLVGLGSWIRSQGRVAKKALQVYAGKAVHILQFRRCLFCIMDVIFREIAQGGEMVEVGPDLSVEMVLLECLLPLAQFDLKARVDPTVTCSDASEHGGGMCFASRLTWAGREEAEKLARGEEALDVQELDDAGVMQGEKILVVDLFSGLGGLELALERAGVKPHHCIIVEKDSACRRLLRRKFPGSDFCGDIVKFNEGMLKKALAKVPGVTGIVVGGGSPCQGLSRLSSTRAHMDDERSALFYEATRIMEMVEDLAESRQLWVLKFLENVVADKEDVREISGALRIHPVLVESGKLGRVRRPRLYWLSWPIGDPGDPSRGQGDLYDVLRLHAEPEPVKCFLKPGTSWPAGEEDPELRFPTFTRCIPRSRPPPCPAGLQTTDQVSQDRWRNDGFRYPPYTYAEQFMVKGSDDVLRPLCAQEREVLMGFPRGYTMSLLKKVPEGAEEGRQAEDVRCAAIGNSFHVNTVAAILDLAFSAAKLKKLKGVQRIVSEFVESLEMPPEPALVKDETVSEPGEELLQREDEEMTLAAVEGLTEWEASEGSLLSEEQLMEQSKELGTRLVSAFIRRQEMRGSDVRLDTGSLFRPDSFPRGSIDPWRWQWHVGLAYRFRHAEHINCLELRAILATFEWRCRSSAFSRCRALHLTDSVVSLSVAVKGRSSSRSLNKLLQRFCALQCAAGVYPVLGWVASEDNPADAPSRRYAPHPKD